MYRTRELGVLKSLIDWISDYLNVSNQIALEMKSVSKVW